MKVKFCHKCHRCNKAFSEIFKVARVFPGTSTDAAREILGFFRKAWGFLKILRVTDATDVTRYSERFSRI